MSAPIIGITCNLLKVEKGAFIGLNRLSLIEEYATAVERAGGTPLILPLTQKEETITHYSHLMDALILSGGQDVHTQLYGQEPRKELGEVLYERDMFEIRLIKKISELKKPILGICRGLQILNVAFGGTLYQDIPTQIPSALQHQQHAAPHVGTHRIEIIENSLLKSILKNSSILTNSYHHQSVDQLAPGFKVTATSLDGVVEAIEKEGEPFVLGVEWHPEVMISSDQSMQDIFDYLVRTSQA